MNRLLGFLVFVALFAAGCTQPATQEPGGAVTTTASVEPANATPTAGVSPTITASLTATPTVEPSASPSVTSSVVPSASPTVLPSASPSPTPGANETNQSTAQSTRRCASLSGECRAVCAQYGFPEGHCAEHCDAQSEWCDECRGQPECECQIQEQMVRNGVCTSLSSAKAVYECDLKYKILGESCADAARGQPFDCHDNQANNRAIFTVVTWSGTGEDRTKVTQSFSSPPFVVSRVTTGTNGAFTDSCKDATTALKHACRGRKYPVTPGDLSEVVSWEESCKYGCKDGSCQPGGFTQAQLDRQAQITRCDASAWSCHESCANDGTDVASCDFSCYTDWRACMGATGPVEQAS